MKKIFSREVLIGFCVLATLLILFFGINYLKGINLFHATNYYFATFTNVDGLAQSAPVTLNGYKVGLVREISYEYDNPGHVLVEMSLNKDLRVPAGSKAILKTDMLGTSTIELKLSDSKDFHMVGDRLVGENPAGLLESVSKDMLPAVANILPQIDSLLKNVNTLVGDPALAASIQSLHVALANLSTTTAVINKSVQPLPGITSDAATTMANVKTLSGDLTTMTAKLSNAPVDSVVENANMLVVQLNEIVAQLRSPDSSIGLLMNDPQLYQNLNGAAAALDSLLQDVKANPKRYISIKLL